MKKSLFVFSIVILLIASFRAGTWNSQRWAVKTDGGGGERRILHYVDPMNPANVSNKPGLAPCGMPMEPVYDDRESDGAGLAGAKGTMSLGTVKISPQKQQGIGVRIGSAEKISETHRIRTLGRIAADENRVFPMVSGVDGWMSYIPGSTTGSQVEKGQLMALIRVFDYDFFSWQQRYLAELANMGRRYLPATNFTGARQPLPYPSQPSSPTTQKPSGEGSMDMSSTPMQVGKMPPAASPPPGKKSTLGMPFSAMKPKFDLPASGPAPMHQPETRASSMQDMPGHSMPHGNERQQGNLDPTYMREDDILYANKAKLELLDLGVQETQLRELAQEGKYVPAIQLRSPATGLVIQRGVSPLQKVDRGTECFRVADLSRVWIYAYVFSSEGKYIQPGMRALVSLPRQRKSIEAVVSDTFPEFGPITRTLNVRLEMDNPNNVFRPDMFVDVEFLIPLPEAITLPAGAVLDSGRRKIVFISLGEGYFEPREVVTGWRFGDRVEIVKGISPGEQIVISGNFLIDSESRMKLAAAGLMAAPKAENGPSDKGRLGTPFGAEPGND